MVLLVPAVRKIFRRIYRIPDEPSSVRCPYDQVSRNEGPIGSAIVNEPRIDAELGNNPGQRRENVPLSTVKMGCQRR